MGIEFPTYSKMGFRNFGNHDANLNLSPLIQSSIYSIDVSSGCIWDPSCIKTSEKII